MKALILKLIGHDKIMPLVMAGVSAFALSMAYSAQYIVRLDPCILCIIQRVPYMIIIVLGLLAFMLSFQCKKCAAPLIGLIGLTFLTNSLIAFYHTGVEQHWWKSILEGCAVPDMIGDMDQILASIQGRTEAAPCDVIPWSDPILDFSMANYNIVFCLGLGLIALISARLIWKKP